MTNDTVLARASKPSKKVAKVVAVRFREETYETLKAQAELAGVKVCDIVRAAAEEFAENAKSRE